MPSTSFVDRRVGLAGRASCALVLVLLTPCATVLLASDRPRPQSPHVILTGYHSQGLREPLPAAEVPRELSKVSLPAYRIEPPDVVQIFAVKLVPRQPYRIEEFDVLQIRVLGTIIDQPIDNQYIVQMDGTIGLGPVYGDVRVLGMSVEEAVREITRHLKLVLQQPVVSMLLSRAGGVQQVNRNYPVQSDGTITLGRYGMVSVAGKTVTEARFAVEKQLSLYFDGPQVGVDVVAYNSKKYYIIIAGADANEPIAPLPITGNETVLDALSQIKGLPQISSKTMWLARPAPSGFGCEQILPIDWAAITRGARADSNYQILPGDRIYIVDDKILATDLLVSKFTTPIERMLTLSGLGASTIRNLQTMGRAYNQNRY